MNATLAPAASIALDDYVIDDSAGLLTPALLIYAEAVASNIAATIRAAGGAERWRPQVKTAKLAC